MSVSVCIQNIKVQAKSKCIFVKLTTINDQVAVQSPD